MLNIYNVFKFEKLINISVFTLSIGIFSGLFLYIPTDLQAHIEQIISINLDEATYPPNFLYYFLVNLFSGFSKNTVIISVIATVLLSSAVTAKYIITKKILVEISVESSKFVNKQLINFLAFILIFSFAIPDVFNLFILKALYLTRIVPNVWHNSTTIFLFPFALLLFWEQFKILKRDSTPTFEETFYVTVLIVINALIKPSFLFVFIPVTGMWIFLKYEFKNFKKMFIFYLPLVIGVLLIGFLTLSIYFFQAGSFQKESSSIVVSGFFEGLRNWIPAWYIPISLTISFILPLVVLISFKRSLLEHKPFLFALCLTVTGILISSLFIETGPRRSHGNFMWQNVICCYLLLLATLSYLIPRWNKMKRKSKTLMGIKIILLGHFLSGIIYFIKIFVTGSYY